MVSNEALGSGRLRILVTGAAGLVGRELCGVLAGRGHAVLALLHSSRTLDRNDGTPIQAVPYDGTMAGGTVAVLGGDVTAEHFGLAPAISAALAAKLDLIVHCAAVTAFNLPDAAYERVNIGRHRAGPRLRRPATPGPAAPRQHRLCLRHGGGRGGGGAASGDRLQQRL